MIVLIIGSTNLCSGLAAWVGVSVVMLERKKIKKKLAGLASTSYDG